MSVDRTHPPAPGPRPAPRLPKIERARLANGLRVASTHYDGTPETLFEIALPGGHVFETREQLGLASLVARAMQEGTRKLSTVEFIDALDHLGADLRVSSDDDELTLSLRVLDRRLQPALELLFDVLLEPRFDDADFERVRKLRLASIAARGDDASAVAADVWRRLMYGDEVSLGRSAGGTAECVARVTTDDLRAFHAAALDPVRARVAVVGRWNASEVVALLAPLAKRWPACRANAMPAFEPRENAARRGLFVVDRPGAPQSELRIGRLAIAAGDPDWLALGALNYSLGGTFTSRINLNLRERNGYTYGARSGFETAPRRAPFSVAAAVHTRFTAAAVREVLAELRGYLDGPTAAEIAFTHSALEQSLARQFESPSARLHFVAMVERVGCADDHPLARLVELQRLGRTGLAALARKHLVLDDLAILVVGDRAAVEPDLAALDLGPLTPLDIDGAPLLGPT